MPPSAATCALTASTAPLRIWRSPTSSPLIRVCAVNLMNVASAASRGGMPYLSLTSVTIERPSGVSSARLDSIAASASSSIRTPAAGQQLGRHPVAVRDRAGLVEQQHVDVAGGLDRATAHRDHVLAHQPVHAGDADRRQQAADRRRDQAHEQRDDHGRRQVHARVDAERHERHAREQEHDREPDEQDVQRDLVRRLLARRALDERDHLVEERLARVRADLARRSCRTAPSCRR